MSMALGFHATTAPLFHLDDVDPATGFLQDIHPDVTDALRSFVYDPLDAAAGAGLDDFLNGPIHDADEPHVAKKPRASSTSDDDAWFDSTAADGVLGLPWGSTHVVPEFLTEFVLPPPPPQMMPPSFVRGADAKKQAAASNGHHQSVQSAAARERRRRISVKTAELSQLIPGGNKLNTAEMLEEAARHVKLLQAQVGMLALLRAVEKEKVPATAQEEEMHALLVCGSVQERLAAEGRCLVPMKLVDAIADDKAVKSNALVKRDLGRFIESLPLPEQ